EAAILELDIAGGGFEHHRRHRLGLFDNGVGGAFERVAADMHAARTVSAAAHRNLVGVALNELDRLNRDAEPFVHYLRVDGLVTLTVRMRAGEDHERAAGVKADDHALIEDR